MTKRRLFSSAAVSAKVTRHQRMYRTCPVCGKSFYRPPCEIRNETPVCSTACAGKRLAVRQKGQTPERAMRAASQARNARLQASIRYYFGKLSEREMAIFRYAWNVAYQRGWNKQRSVRRRQERAA